MQKIAAVIVATIILLQCSVKTGFVAYFHLNQDYIASSLCENKDNVKMNCKGKCYLNKKIKEQEKNENKLASILKELKDGKVFCSYYELNSPEISFSSSVKNVTSYLTKSYTSPLVGILQPPC